MPTCVDDIHTLVSSSLAVPHPRTRAPAHPRAVIDDSFRSERSDSGALARFTRDLTADARAGRLEIVRCRDEEIARTIDILLRQGKNNPALVGAAGVGKTAIAEGLAQRVAAGTVPIAMRDLRLLWSQALTIALVVASGIGGFVATLSAVESLAQARDDFYAQAHFADVFAMVKRGGCLAEYDQIEQKRRGGVKKALKLD